MTFVSVTKGPNDMNRFLVPLLFLLVVAPSVTAGNPALHSQEPPREPPPEDDVTLVISDDQAAQIRLAFPAS